MTPPTPVGQVDDPVYRDLVKLAMHPDFARRRAQIASTGGCSNPVHLVGHKVERSADGSVIHSFSTDNEPDGRLLVACGNRRVTRCPSCSAVYRVDTFQLIRAGLVGGKGVPAEVRTHPRVFATLTAPSFGPVHNRPTRSRKVVPCRCGTLHGEEDPLLGRAIDPTTYDYEHAVLWNAHAGQLWARFTKGVRNELAAIAGMTQKEFARLVRVSFAKVAEYQARGSVHFHAVIRVDGLAVSLVKGKPRGTRVIAPPTWATVATLTEAIQTAARPSRSLVDATTGTRDLPIVWGRQLDIRPIGDADGEDLSDRAIAAYVAKYATKGAESTGTIDRPIYCRHCSGTGLMLRTPERDVPCRNCLGDGLAVELDGLDVDEHARRMIAACWDLGGRRELADARLRRWAHMLGYRGHFSTKSRQYSTTLTALRGARAAWRSDQARQALGLPLDEPARVVADFAFVGMGYSPGEQLIASAVRRDLDLTRQLLREGLDELERAA